MLYTASSRSLAVLEVLVHIAAPNMPDNFCMVIMEAPDDVEELDTHLLPGNWQEYPEINLLKTLGNDFLKRTEHLLLKVPSAIVHEEFNYLLNPLHPKAAELKVISRQPFILDPRLSVKKG